MNFIDILIVIGIAQGILLGLALLSLNRGNKTANRLLGILMISFSLSISHILLNILGYIDKYPHLIRINHPIVFLFGPLFYFYVKELIAGEFKFKIKEWIHFLPFFLFVIYLLPFFIQSAEYKLARLEQWRTEGSLLDTIVTLLQAIHLFIYLFFVNRIVKTHRERIKQSYSSLEKINLSWVRLIIWMLIGVFFVMVILIIMSIFGFTQFLTEYGGKIIAVLVSLSIYSAGYFGLRQPEIFIGQETSGRDPQKYKKSPLTAEKSETLKNKLTDFMETTKPYIKNDLKISELAAELTIPAYQLSQIINEKFNQNFFDFINRYRIEEAKKILRDKRKNHLSIIAIADDVGFNSKSAFNTAFKKHTGMTPSQFRYKQN